MNDAQLHEMSLLSKVTEAVQEYTAYKEWIDPGEFMGDWVLVLHLANMDPEVDEAYVQISSTTNMPSHVSVGLLQAGLDQIRSGMHRDEE